jgi:hypothetical protein
MIATLRPATLPNPVITPSAGNSSASVLASVASSTKLSASVSRAMRSRANSLPYSAFF